MRNRLSEIIKSDAGQLVLILLLVLLIGIYEGGIVRATRGVAGVIVLMGVSWVVFNGLMWIFRKQTLTRSFVLVLLIVALSCFALAALNRGEYILVASVPGAILGIAAFLLSYK